VAQRGHKTQWDPKYAGLNLCALLHRLDLLFHWLESGSEHGGGQLGNVLAVADSDRHVEQRHDQRQHEDFAQGERRPFWALDRRARGAARRSVLPDFKRSQETHEAVLK